MKRIKRWLAIAAGSTVFLLLFWAGHMLVNASSLSAERDLSALTINRSYWLEAGEVLTFSLEAGRTKFRLLTNAALDRMSTNSEGKPHYSLNYRVLDAQGRQLRAANYYLRLHTSLYGNQPKRSFQTRLATPSDTNLFYLDLTQDAGAHTLELRMGPSSRLLAGMAVRPYYQELHPPERLERIWERLHESRHEQLAEPNVLGVEFLTDLEKRALVSTFWHPAAPRGIEGADYEIALLIDELVDRQVAGSLQVADRWFLPAGRAASLGLTTATELLVSASSVSGRVEPTDLRVFWSGRLQHERAELVLESNGLGLKSTTVLDRGIVTFEAARDLWLETADALQGRPLRPEPNIVRVYNAGVDTVLIPVRHLPSLSTPIRLDLRVEPGITTPQLEVSFVGQGGVESTRTLEVPAEPSPRDWLVRGGRQAPISVRHRVYLSVPGNVTGLRLASKTELWVSAYNRPPEMTQRVQIPDSLFGGTEDTRRYPRWFVLSPRNAEALIGNGSSALVQVALKPPDGRARAEELSFSERLFPQQRWRGINVLARNDPRQEISAAALGNTFQPLVKGEQLIHLMPAPGANTVKPTLLIKQAAAGKGQLVIDAEGKRLVDREVTARSGRIELPELPGGRQRWRVQAPESMALYLSDLEARSPSFRAHNLQATTGNRFRYQLQRFGSSRELLAFRVFSAEPGRVRLRVSFEPWQRGEDLHSDWTIESAEYDLALEETSRTFALADDVDALSYEALAFHTIGSDVPAGTHHLSVEIADPVSSAAGGSSAERFLGVTRSGVAAEDDATLRIRHFEVTSR